MLLAQRSDRWRVATGLLVSLVALSLFPSASMASLDSGCADELLGSFSPSTWGGGAIASRACGVDGGIQGGWGAPSGGGGPTVTCPPTCTTPAAGGSNHSLALLQDATVWAWGRNDYGQLGNGVDANSGGIRVAGLSGAVSVAAGKYHSLALKSDGSVKSWGVNNFGQLGDTTTTSRSSPTSVPGLQGIQTIAAGANHSVALRSDGTVWAWGANYSGQLGSGTTNTVLAPVRVSGLSGVTAIAAGHNHSLALKADGTVWAWGANSHGELGDGTTTRRLSPVQIPSLTAISIAAGAFHSLASKSDGTVRDWGLNTYGQLGNGTTATSSSPVVVSGLSGVKQVTGGHSHSMALKTNGTVWAWGYNKYGALGNFSTTHSSTPVQTMRDDHSALTNVSFVVGGYFQSIAVEADGRLTEWGHHPDDETDCLAARDEDEPTPADQPKPAPKPGPGQDPPWPPITEQDKFNILWRGGGVAPSNFTPRNPQDVNHPTEPNYQYPNNGLSTYATIGKACSNGKAQGLPMAFLEDIADPDLRIWADEHEVPDANGETHGHNFLQGNTEARHIQWADTRPGLIVQPNTNAPDPLTDKLIDSISPVNQPCVST